MDAKIADVFCKFVNYGPKLVNLSEHLVGRRGLIGGRWHLSDGEVVHGQLAQIYWPGRPQQGLPVRPLPSVSLPILIFSSVRLFPLSIVLPISKLDQINAFGDCQ